MNNLPKKPETEIETKVAIKSKKYSIKQHQLYLMIFLVVIFSLFGLSAFASPSTEWKKEGDDPWVGALSHQGNALLAFFMFDDCSVDLDVHLRAPVTFSNHYQENQKIEASIKLVSQDRKHEFDNEATIEELIVDEDKNQNLVILNFGTFKHVKHVLRAFDPSKVHVSFSINNEILNLENNVWDFTSFEDPISKLAASCKQYEPAKLYDEGQRFLSEEKNHKSNIIAFNLINEAAQSGYAPAMAGLSELYQKGAGVDQNLEIAIIWLELAAENQVPTAQFKLGKFYKDGLALERDLDKAERLLQASLANGVEHAALELSDLKELKKIEPYLDSEFRKIAGIAAYQRTLIDLISGNKRSQKTALTNLENWAFKGDGSGYFILAHQYTERDWIIGSNQKARRSIQRALNIAWKQLNTDLLIKIAELYETGKIVPKSAKRAISLYERAARLSDPKANLKLGNLILDEAKNIADLDRAFEAFWLAAREQSSQANRCLSLFYAFGLAVEADAEEAVRYSKLASTEENPQNFVCSFERIKELSVQIS